MESRERVEQALNHEEPDRVPLDLGGSAVTRMHVSTVYKLRQALELDPPGTPVKVPEPFQMLGARAIFGENGGFMFNTIHNVQPKVPVENVLAIYDAFKSKRSH